MKTRKAFLAKVLAAAVTITSLLPGGAVTADAADIQKSEEGWKVQKQASDWSDDFDDFLNLGGIQTWHIESTDADANVHNQGLAAASAPAAVYAADIDITAPDTTEDGTPNRIISFDILPKHKEGSTGSTADDMRFGVLLKYVDPVNWVYLGYDPTGWFLEWDVQGESSYRSGVISKTQFALEDDTFHHIEIEYLSSKAIKVTLQKMEQNDDGEWVATSDEPVTTTLNDACIEHIKRYATISAQAPEGSDEELTLPLPIYFGFKAGTYSGTKTNVDIANVETNANIRNEMESLRYAYCGWTAIKAGRNPREILSVASVGGVNYSSIDASESDTAKTVSYTNSVMDDFSEGSVSAVLRPFGEEDSNVTSEFYLNAKAATSQDPLGVQVGYNGTNWGYKIGNDFTAATTQVAGPKAMHDYKVDISFTGDNHFNASIVEVQHAGDEDEVNGGDDYLKGDFSTVVANSEIKIAENVALPDDFPETGTVSITAGAGLNLRLRNVNYSKTTYQSATDFLGNAYTTVMNRNNNDNTFYTAAWENFAAARTAASGKLTAQGVMTEQGARSLLKEMEDAWTALNVDDNKIAPDKAKLNAAKTEIDGYIASKDNYDYDGTALTNQLDTVLSEVTGLIDKTPASLTKSEVTTALANWTAEKAKIAEKKATAEDKAALDTAITEAAGKYNAADADYYDNWSNYADALAAVNELKAAENPSKLAITNAIAALKDAMEKLELKAATSAEKSAFESSLTAIKNDVNGKLQPDAAYNAALKEAEDLLAEAAPKKKSLDEALAKVQAAKNNLKPVDTTPAPPVSQDPAVGAPYTDAASGMAYTVGANQTVTLTSGNKTAKTVTINSVTINGKEYKVTEIAANAFKNAKMTKLTVGDNVTTINKNAFAGCKALKTVVIGQNVKSIKANAFSKCTKINTVTFKNAKKLPSMKNAFKNANKKPKKVNVKKALVKNAKKKKSVLNALKAAGFKKITAKNIKGVK